MFNLGLLLLSLNYLPKAKVRVAFIAVAALVLWHLIPAPFRSASHLVIQTMYLPGMLFSFLDVPVAGKIGK